MSYTVKNIDIQQEETITKDDLLRSLDETIKNQKGVLFTLPAIVHRGAYSGRDLIAKNSGSIISNIYFNIRSTKRR